MNELSEIINSVLRPVWGVMAMGIFCGITLWAYWPNNKGRFEADGLIPFKDEER
jgi:cytochrome c oxidase cbb3-type subunit IV